MLWSSTSNITYIDLSFNRLQGTLPSDSELKQSLLQPAPSIISSTTANSKITPSKFSLSDYVHCHLNLQVNELSGTIPSVLWNDVNIVYGSDSTSTGSSNSGNYDNHCTINILEGNLFDCNTRRTNLPNNDPNKDSYLCGSDATKNSLITFAVISCICGFILMITLRTQIHEWKHLFYSTVLTNRNLSHIERMLLLIDRMTCILALFIVMVCMIVYRIIHRFASTYTYTYGWIVSSIYVSGIIPCIVFFLLLTVFLFIVIIIFLIPLMDESVSTNYMSNFVVSSVKYPPMISTGCQSPVQYPVCEPPIQSSLSTTNVTITTQNPLLSNNSSKPINTDSKQDNNQPCNQLTTTNNNTPTSDSTNPSISSYTWSTVVMLMNITFVTAINGLYIHAVNNAKYGYASLIVISFLMSVFKLLWAFVVLLGGWEIPDSLKKRFFGLTHTNPASLSSTLLTDNTVVWICLFNHLIAPFIAEAFVSPNCFLYLVSPQPQSNAPYLDIIHVNTVNTITLIPPFHYSYQCSFTLVSSYVYIFIFRYILSGMILPLLTGIWRWYIDIYRTHGLSTIDCFLKIHLFLITNISPTLWRLHRHVDDHIAFENSLQSMELQLSKLGRFKRKLLVRYVTDFSMLISFGILFPPLAFVIAISLLKDTWEMRLSLGRLNQLSLKLTTNLSSTSTITDRETVSGWKVRIDKMLHIVEKETKDAQQMIWSGVWYGTCISVWIWAIVLFDILSVDIGIARSIWMVAVMLVLPYIIRYGIGHMIAKSNMGKLLADKLFQPQSMMSYAANGVVQHQHPARSFGMTINTNADLDNNGRVDVGNDNSSHMRSSTVEMIRPSV